MVQLRYRDLPPRACPGFTLIEAMVALLVLSVGVIGVAALHGQSLAASRTAIFRSQALNLASDMADRIRANSRGGAAYAGAGADRGCDTSTGAANRCTPDEMAAHDLFVWNAIVTEALPDGEGFVSVDAAEYPPTYTVNVSWADGSDSGRSALPLSFRLTAN